MKSCQIKAIPQLAKIACHLFDISDESTTALQGDECNRLNKYERIGEERISRGTGIHSLQPIVTIAYRSDTDALQQRPRLNTPTRDHRAGLFTLQETVMKSNRILKTLSIAAVAALSLTSGISQAEGWGRYERAYAPNISDQGRFDHRDPDIRWSDNQRASFDIDERQQEQMERIMHGLRDGRLSRIEADKLMHQQRKIELLQRQYLSDRHLSRSEWIDLDRRLDRQAHNIRAEKHDRDWR